jgi:hypothetical protein
MDSRDLRISRKLQKIIRKVEQLVAKEVGEEIGVTLIVHPWRKLDEPEREAEMQYISNMPRTHTCRKACARW